MTRFGRRLGGLLFGGLLFGGLLFGGLVLAALPAGAADLSPQPASPQPAAVQPGLSIVYFRNTPFDSVQEVVRFGKPGKGSPGAPIPDINAKGGKGELWESHGTKFFGVRIDGLIKLEAGSTAFSANSNDGFRLLIGGVQVLEDADVHLDRIAGPVTVTVAQAGWYPLQLWYFQKRGGASMELFWQPPGSSAPVPVPPAAFGHP